MSLACMNHVWMNAQHSATELLVLLAIADFADDRGLAFPSVATLAKKSRTTERNVQRVLGKLQEAGSLSVDPGKGPFGTNLYRVNMGGDRLSPPTKCQGDTQRQKGVTPVSPKPSIEPITSSLRSEVPAQARTRKATQVPLPDDFVPNADAHEVAKAFKVDLAHELAIFCDYFRSTGKLKVDWQSTFRNWLRRARQFDPVKPQRADVDYSLGLPGARGGKHAVAN